MVGQEMLSELLPAYETKGIPQEEHAEHRKYRCNRCECYRHHSVRHIGFSVSHTVSAGQLTMCLSSDGRESVTWESLREPPTLLFKERASLQPPSVEPEPDRRPEHTETIGHGAAEVNRRGLGEVLGWAGD